MDLSTFFSIVGNQRHGIYGHSAAWRIWNYEESVCIQTAGLYAASIELMSNFMLPNELTSVVSDFLTNWLVVLGIKSVYFYFTLMYVD